MATPDTLDVNAWHLVDLQANTGAVWRPHLQHSHTRVDEMNLSGANQTGFTVWATMFSGHQIGIGWAWISIGRQVVAMANPMQISTNIRLFNADGIQLRESSVVVHLNDVIHDLPWQQFVVKSTRRNDSKHYGLNNARSWSGAIDARTHGRCLGNY
ncbi:hypothetical protein [Paucibacter soli]|uniref:hypothetical protein n=1 Tax=Paucibacter soli TaxID=3133433 RepID=UPI0030A4CBFE